MATVISGDTGVSQVQDGVVQTEDIAAEAVSFSKLLQSEWGKNLAASGYQKLPSGLIIQWATVASSGANATYSFPIAFPTACVGFGAWPQSANSSTNGAPTSASQFAMASYTGGTTPTAMNVRYIALGY